MKEITIAFQVVMLNIILFYIALQSIANHPGDWSTPEDGVLSNQDAMYFILTTLSTVGYGDISPKSKRAKNLVMIFQFTMLIELFAFIIKKIKF